MVDLTSIWPDWGSQGDQPPDGTDYSAGDNPKAQHYNHLWFRIKDTFSSVESWVTSVEDKADQNSSDITNLESGKADDPHGNAAHSETYAVDGDAQPPQTHDNTAHSQTYAVDGDAQPPQTHDNTAHSTNYAVDGDAQPPQTHDNSAHSEDYLTSADVDSGVTDINGASGSVNFYHSDLFGVGSSDHHPRYTDNEAISAIENEGLEFSADSVTQTFTNINSFTNGDALEARRLITADNGLQIQDNWGDSTWVASLMAEDSTTVKFRDENGNALWIDMTSGDLSIRGSLTENASL